MELNNQQGLIYQKTDPNITCSLKKKGHRSVFNSPYSNDNRTSRDRKFVICNLFFKTFVDKLAHMLKR